MALAVGTKLGPYEIMASLGAGGMGEVYRVVDNRLKRAVAIKVLPSSFASDEEWLRRFEQEARAAAALNDPHIIAVYDVGNYEGAPYIVSELVEGNNLRQHLKPGALPKKAALDYALQIIRGLAAAHDKGIIHRDLKPENILIAKDGVAKILDFGLAKLTRSESFPRGEGTTVLATQPGMVLGTVGYMPPEQLCAEKVDHRSDIFSFGAILYEMLTGKRAFHGESTGETFRMILKDEPDSLQQIGGISSGLERVVRHCLEKDPARRFRSAHDLAFDLETVAAEPGVAPSPPIGTERAPWVIAVLATVILVAALTIFFAGHRKEPAIPVYHPLTFSRGTIFAARYGPDGRTIVYSAAWEGKAPRLFATRTDFPDARPLQLTANNLLGISRSGELALAVGGEISADAAFDTATIARADLSGGAPREVLHNVTWADWSPDGTLAVVHRINGLNRLEYPIGKVLYQTSGWIGHIRFNPKGDLIAFMDHAVWPDDRGDVSVIDLEGKKRVLSAGWETEYGLAWTPAGNEIWFTAAKTGVKTELYATSLSGKERIILRAPGPLFLQDIYSDGHVLVVFENRRTGMKLVNDAKTESDLSWFDWTFANDISADGNWVLFDEQGDPVGANYMVGIRKADRSAPVFLGEGGNACLAPDAKSAFAIVSGATDRLTLMPIEAGEARAIDLPGIEHLGFGISGCHYFPDGKRLLVNGNEPGHAYRAYIVDVRGGKPSPITPEGTTANIVSPDGSLIAGVAYDQTVAIYPVSGGPGWTIPGSQNLYPIRFGVGNDSVYATRMFQPPAQVYRLDVKSGRKQLVRELIPADPTGVYAIAPVLMTPDGKTYVYSYGLKLSELYSVDGLK